MATNRAAKRPKRNAPEAATFNSYDRTGALPVIDIYCERTGPGLLAEPVNAITNLAFLLAAAACWRLAEGVVASRQQRRRPRETDHKT